MDNNFINIDDLIRQRLGGAEEPERSGSWNRMRDLLDEEMPKKRAVGFIYWRRMMGAVGALLLVGGIALGGYEWSAYRNLGNGNTAMLADKEGALLPTTGSTAASHTEANTNNIGAASNSLAATVSANELHNTATTLPTAGSSTASALANDPATPSMHNTGAHGRSSIPGSGIVSGSKRSEAGNNQMAMTANNVSTNAVTTSTKANVAGADNTTTLARNSATATPNSTVENTATGKGATSVRNATAANVTGAKTTATGVKTSATGTIAKTTPPSTTANQATTTTDNTTVTGKKDEVAQTGNNTAAAPAIAANNSTTTTNNQPSTAATENTTTTISQPLSGSAAKGTTVPSGASDATNKAITSATATTGGTVKKAVTSAKPDNQTTGSTATAATTKGANRPTAVAKTKTARIVARPTATAAKPTAAKGDVNAGNTFAAATTTGTAATATGTTAATKPTVLAAATTTKTNSALTGANNNADLDETVINGNRMVKKVMHKLVINERYIRSGSDIGQINLDTISMESIETLIREVQPNNQASSADNNGKKQKSSGKNANANAVGSAANGSNPSSRTGTQAPGSAAGKTNGISGSAKDVPLQANAADYLGDAAASKKAGAAAIENLTTAFNDVKYKVKGVQFAPGMMAGINATFFGPNSFKGFQFGLSGNFIFDETFSVMAEAKYFNRINNDFTMNDNYYNYVQDKASGLYAKELWGYTYNFSTLHSFELPVTARVHGGNFDFYAGGNFVYAFAINTDAAPRFISRDPNAPLVAAIGSDNKPSMNGNDFNSRLGIGYVLGLSYYIAPNMTLDLRNVQTVWDNAGTAGSKKVSSSLYRSPSFQLSFGFRFGGKSKDNE